MNNIRDEIAQTEINLLTQGINNRESRIAALEAENQQLREALARPCQYHHLPLINGWSHVIDRGTGLMGDKKVFRCPLSDEARALLEAKP